jgi:4-amino-4-deoxy-L-arabinose transferase-like glycosyltransferase
VSRFLRLLLVVVVVAFGVRLSYVALAKSGPCPIDQGGTVRGSYPSECALGDQLFYNSEANAVADGRGFVEPLWRVTHPGETAPPAADHPPLTVFVLTPVSWVFDREPLRGIGGDRLQTHVREHRYTMVLLGTLLVFLVGLLGRRVGGDTVGLVAAAIAALTPNLWVNDGVIMSESVTGLTVVGALLLALAVRDKPTILRAVAFGAVCGLAALARAELVLFLPLLAVVVCITLHRPWRDRLALSAVAVGVGALVIAPWVGFNLSRFHDRTFISTNDGIALLGSNCDQMYSGPSIGLTSIKPPDSCLPDPPPPGDQSQVASIYRRRAFDFVRDHERRLPAVVAARIGRTWSVFRPLDMIRFNEGEGREPWVTRLGLVAYYPTLVAAIGGAVVLWRRRARAAVWVLLVPCIAVTVGVAVTYGQTRFRAAAEPSLAVFAAVAIVALVRHFRTSRASAEPPPGESVSVQSVRPRPVGS